MPAAFPKSGIQFLKELERHNDRNWFQANKARYASDVREPMITLVTAVNDALTGFAKEYLAELPRAISRPNRDVRFSKDKSPYRTDIAAVFPRAGLEKHEAAGFFFRVAASGAEVIGGTYMPGPDQLKRIRRWLDRKHEELAALIGEASLRRVMGQLQGDQLKRVPAGFAPDHPAQEHLRRTQFYFRRELPVAVVTSPSLEKEIVRSFRAASTFVAALDRAMANT